MTNYVAVMGTTLQQACSNPAARYGCAQNQNRARMSQLLIQHYLNNLADLRAVSGEAREGIVSEAFKTLLKDGAARTT
jgi:hypothetical protein